MAINGGTVNFASGCASERALDATTPCPPSIVSMSDTLTLTDGAALRGGSLRLLVTSSVSVDTTSSIDVENGGYSADNGPGACKRVRLLRH